MKFINKNDYSIVEIESKKASDLRVKNFAVLGTDIIPEIKYTTGLLEVGTETHNTIDFPVCVEILEMTQAEKDAYEAAIVEAARRASFNGSKVKIKADYDWALINMNGFVLKCSSDTTIKDTVVKSDPDIDGVVIKTAVIRIDGLLQSDYDTIKTLIPTYVQIDTIDDDDIESIDVDKYKYLIPNNVS